MKRRASCPNCGAVADSEAQSCARCGGVIPVQASPPSLTELREAATVWAGGITGAPRDFGALITQVENRDEVIERSFSKIVRRDLLERRAPWDGGRVNASRLDIRQVDPFTVALDSLRTASLHLATCNECRGGGRVACARCGGRGRVDCSTCGGSGKTIKHYKKTSRTINCKACRGGGTEVCGSCAAGTVTCSACLGRREQVVWFEYEERSRTLLSLEPPESPILLGYPQLGLDRAVSVDDLKAFSVLALSDAPGPLESERGTDDAAYNHALMRALDSRLERVVYQQYVRLAVVRRDATYELCGMRGVLVLSGAELKGASTQAALRPIRTRLLLWSVGGLLLVFAASALAGKLVGGTAYFERTDRWVSIGVWSAAILAVLVLGACLRELRPGPAFGSLRQREKLAGVSALALLAAVATASMLGRPGVDEVHHALSVGDVPAARRVTEALAATVGRTKEVAEADDRVVLAEARTASLPHALKLLDGIAQSRRSKAPEAARTARELRLAEITRHLGLHAGGDARALIDRWFAANWRADAEVAELYARAEEVELAECTTLACRFVAARKAAEAAETPARAQRAESSRHALLEALLAPEQPSEPVLGKLQRLRALVEDGAAALKIAGEDLELAASVARVAQIEATQRSRTALIGADEGVLGEIVATFSPQNENVSLARLDGVSVYAVFDKRRTCRGIYAVGPSEGARGIVSSAWTGARLVSQAVGRPAALNAPSQSASVSRWVEAGVPIVARWRAGSLVELRIGDAAP